MPQGINLLAVDLHGHHRQKTEHLTREKEPFSLIFIREEQPQGPPAGIPRGPAGWDWVTPEPLGWGQMRGPGLGAPRPQDIPDPALSVACVNRVVKTSLINVSPLLRMK